MERKKNPSAFQSVLPEGGRREGPEGLQFSLKFGAESKTKENPLNKARPRRLSGQACFKRVMFIKV